MKRTYILYLFLLLTACKENGDSPAVTINPYPNDIFVQLTHSCTLLPGNIWSRVHPTIRQVEFYTQGGTEIDCNNGVGLDHTGLNGTWAAYWVSFIPNPLIEAWFDIDQDIYPVDQPENIWIHYHYNYF